MSIETLAENEVAQFLVGGPTLEEIIAFHASPEVNERMYELIEREQAGEITEDEQSELETYLYIDHLMRLIKGKAHQKLAQRAL
jgi:hypothetical protein